MLLSVLDRLPRAATFDSASPLYAAIRWIWFSALIGLIGAVTFRIAILPRCGVDPPSRDSISRTAFRIALLSAVIVLVSALARWAAQTIAVFGSLSSDALILLSTGWGRGLILQTAAALLALGGFLGFRRSGSAAWSLAAVAAIASAVAPAFSGHAAAADLQPWATIADAAHVLGAGAWIGSLLVVTVIAVSTARHADPGQPHVDLAALVHAFSPVALAAAALLLLSGAFSSWLHLHTPGPLFRSAYGRLLLLKLAAVALTAAAGAWNWRRVRPDLGTPPASDRLRRSTRLELGFALLVLLVTAVLVASEPPFGG